MGIENNIKKVSKTTAPLRFLIFPAIIFVIFGLIIRLTTGNNYEKTEGTVTACEYMHDWTDDTTYYSVDFNYTVNGVNYNGNLRFNKARNIGDKIEIYYDVDNPDLTSNTKNPQIIGYVLMGVGALMAVFAISKTVKLNNENKKMEEYNKKYTNDINYQYKFEERDFSENEEEYYFMFTGGGFKISYALEDKNRVKLIECEMTKNSPFAPREFKFRDLRDGVEIVHKLSHVVTTTINNEVFSTNSTFKYDGVDIWKYFHQNGFRFETDLSTLPATSYKVYLYNRELARVVNTGKFVHEEDEIGKANIPFGRYYYRVFTKDLSLHELFLFMVAVSDTNMLVVD